MAIEQVRVRITGTQPLFMHSNRGVNPRDPDVIELKKVTGKRKKTEEDLETIAFMEWKLGLYHDAKIGPYLRGDMIHACLRDGGKRSKRGKLVVEAVWIDDSMIPLEYDGPRDLDGLYASGTFFDMRPAKVQTSTVMRSRPYFPRWAATFTITYDAESIDRGDILHILDEAGRRCGLGDYRPQYGRFTAEEITSNGR